MNIEDLEDYLNENPNGIIFITSNNLNDSIMERYLDKLGLPYKKVNIINLGDKILKHLKVGIGVNLYFFINKEIKIYIGDVISFDKFNETLKELDSF